MAIDYEVVVLGGGPAGISAGIYAKRAGASVLVIDGGNSALARAKKIENYYGIESISGEELLKRGTEQYKKLGGDYFLGEVTQIKNNYDEHAYTIQLGEKSIKTKAVILALGQGKKKCPGYLLEYQDSNVSYCAICDGFFFSGKNVAVIGGGDFALSEAEELSKNAKVVYVIGKNIKKIAKLSKNIKIIDDEAVGASGKNKVEELKLASGKNVKVDGVFVAEGSLSSFEIAKQLGLIVKDNNIVIDKSCMTNLAGVLACGDCVGGLLQVSKAVGEGAVAGIEAVRYIRIMEDDD